nr:helix-turn-helix transcriptional regulator [uncultured Cohaesibacter sp.]
MKKSPNEYDVYVGSRVRMARTMIGMSQEKLGAHLGITFQQIQKYEKGTNRISASRLVELGRVLEKPISWFFEGVESKARSENSLEAAFQTVLGGRLLSTFFKATNDQRKMIADLTATVVQGDKTKSIPAE